MRWPIRITASGEPSGSGIAESRQHSDRRTDRLDHGTFQCELAGSRRHSLRGGCFSRAGARQPLFTGLRVYNVPVDFDQFPSGQRQLQTAVKNIGTSWSLSPIQLQQAVEAGRVLLRQHPCFQRLRLDLNASTAPVAPQAVRNSCPFEDDKAS